MTRDSTSGTKHQRVERAGRGRRRRFGSDRRRHRCPFFDHMLSQLGKHGGLDLTVKTKGDLDVDAHHTVEDTSLAVGQALREALGRQDRGTTFWLCRSAP